MYKNLLSFNEEDIFENIFFVVVKMKSGIMKVVNIKIFNYLLVYILL